MDVTGGAAGSTSWELKRYGFEMCGDEITLSCSCFGASAKKRCAGTGTRCLASGRTWSGASLSRRDALSVPWRVPAILKVIWSCFDAVWEMRNAGALRSTSHVSPSIARRAVNLVRRPATQHVCNPRVARRLTEHRGIQKGTQTQSEGCAMWDLAFVCGRRGACVV